MSSLTALAMVLALTAAADERTVCVPAVDGSGWQCGKGDQAPAARSLPRTHQLTPSAPPPYLMDPASMPSVTREPPPAAAVTTEPNPAPQPEPEPTPEPASLPAPLPAPEPQPAAEPAPIAAQPEPIAEPQPTPVPEPQPAPIAEQAQAPETVSTPAPTATAAATPVARIVSSVARDAADLLALPGTGYTVQLAAASGLQGFTRFRQKLGIAVEDTFVIRVRRGSEDWWLMLWRDFADLDSARSAAATLSAHGSFWPRRLAPLQGEVRATPN